MKKKILLFVCALALTIAPTFAAPQGGGHGGGGMHSGAPSMNRGGSMPSSHMGGARPSNMGARPMNMGGGRAPMAGSAKNHGGAHFAGARPAPMYRPYHHHIYRPIYPAYPYYSYYPTYYTSYAYYPTNYVYDDVPVATEGGTTVIVKDDYAGVNATANVINAAANAAAAIKFLTW
jgi:hypothetical protein